MELVEHKEANARRSCCPCFVAMRRVKRGRCVPSAAAAFASRSLAAAAALRAAMSSMESARAGTAKEDAAVARPTTAARRDDIDIVTTGARTPMVGGDTIGCIGVKL